MQYSAGVQQWMTTTCMKGSEYSVGVGITNIPLEKQTNCKIGKLLAKHNDD